MPSAADRAVPQPNAPAAGVAAFVAERARTPGFALSAALHGTLLVAVLLSPAARHLVSFPELEVSVDILTPDEFARAIDRPVARPSEATPEFEPGGLPEQDAPVETPSTVHPTTMLSARALADPRSSKAVAALRTLVGGERMVQLCNLEAMEQSMHGATGSGRYRSLPMPREACALSARRSSPTERPSGRATAGAISDTSASLRRAATWSISSSWWEMRSVATDGRSWGFPADRPRTDRQHTRSRIPGFAPSALGYQQRMYHRHRCRRRQIASLRHLTGLAPCGCWASTFRGERSR